MKFHKNYFKAIAVMVGYIIGVGMFSLPYLVAKVGVLGFFFWLAILVPVQHVIHLVYASMILATKKYHRLTGYAGIYLGPSGKFLVFIAKMIGNYGALLAYIIITGIFLHQLLSPIFGGSEFFYATVLFAIEAIIIYFGIGMIARAELFMTGLLLLVVMLVAWRGWGVIEISNYHVFDWKYFLLPYGAMLFALDGNGSLPMVAKLIKRDKKCFKSVIRAGYALSVLVIIAFTLLVVGISGSLTTPDALTGINQMIGNGVVFFALIFGVLTMITSFFGVAESVRETFMWDFNVNKKVAWALAVLVPFVFYVLGVRNLSEVVSLAGAVAGGLCAIMMFLIYLKMKKTKNKSEFFKYSASNHLIYVLIAMFVCGVVYEIYYFLIK
ncbi:MAG: aromatic amino acid transport family protein [Patescibacteria group bacterium]|nr:aromatic amino acid transport family protein [Patescibacteria group bacterium]